MNLEEKMISAFSWFGNNVMGGMIWIGSTFKILGGFLTAFYLCFDGIQLIDQGQNKLGFIAIYIGLCVVRFPSPENLMKPLIHLLGNKKEENE